MIQCDRCNCRCDPGDLVNGICDDCREEEGREQERHQKMSYMLNAGSKQMELQDFLA